MKILACKWRKTLYRLALNNKELYGFASPEHPRGGASSKHNFLGAQMPPGPGVCIPLCLPLPTAGAATPGIDLIAGRFQWNRAHEHKPIGKSGSASDFIKNHDVL